MKKANFLSLEKTRCQISVSPDNVFNPFVAGNTPVCDIIVYYVDNIAVYV